ncbi:MAG: hypothetical protein Q7J44_14205 [Pseudotabrizicola sp.]|uniref:phage tail tube protein n=1 Tax=Pseudotabrizicola sp. TaxID=2939647 RepID=UPI0027289C3A|nr:phage tail tube protein [Pseudotabrizicola sp.]MDO9639689.1 hypothetical protein [Pseudotabrizicola sp.]
MAQKYWKKKVLLVKTEVTYGTDPVPTGADNAVLALQVTLSPMEGQDVARELERAAFGADGTIPSDLHAKIRFRVELAPSGTAGTAPAWGPLLRACGCAQVIEAGVAVTYNPISDDPESVTMHFHYDGIRHRLRGARGTVKMMIEASGLPYLEFEFWGLFEPATDVVNPVATLSAFRDPLVANMANTPVFTIDGVAMVLRSFSFDTGATVEPRFLIGSEAILITGREEKIEARVEARAMSVFNPYTRARDAAKMPIVLQHGVTAGNRATLNVPLAQIQRPAGIEQQQNIAEWPLNFVPQMTTGNDQWTLALT